MSYQMAIAPQSPNKLDRQTVKTPIELLPQKPSVQGFTLCHSSNRFKKHYIEHCIGKLVMNTLFSRSQDNYRDLFIKYEKTNCIVVTGRTGLPAGISFKKLYKNMSTSRLPGA